MKILHPEERLADESGRHEKKKRTEENLVIIRAGKITDKHHKIFYEEANH